MNQINNGQPPAPPPGGPAGQQPGTAPGPGALPPEAPPAAAYQEKPRRVKTWMILVGVGVLLLALGFLAAPWSASVAAAPVAKVAAEGKLPRAADGKPDFSGIWQTTSAADFDLEPHSNRKDAPPGPGVVEGNVIPYLPKALEQKKKNFV